VPATSHLSLLDAGVFGPMRRTPGRTLLAVIAIALGVALGMAVYLVNRSAADEVSRAARSLFGLADLAVEATGEGFDEALYPRIVRIDGIEAVSPLVEVEAKLLERRGSLTFFGVDAFRSRDLQPALADVAGAMSAEGLQLLDPDAVFLSATAARDLGLRAGDELNVQIGLQPVRFEIAGVLPGAVAERAAFVDIATAQWKFGRLGKLTRLNLRIAAGANHGRVREELRKALPPQARLVTPGEASDEALRLSRAYRSNLTALGLVALFTGGFFVYSTQSLATLRRRREFALLHALGVTRAQQLALMLAGGAILGLCGAVAGIVLGIAVAGFGLNALGADLGAGYFRGVMSRLQVAPGEIVGFCLLGCAVAIAGTLRPALEAARTPTAAALKSGDVESSQLHTRGGIVAALFTAALAALLLPPVGGLPLPGYVSIALLIGAAVVAMPSIMHALLARMPRLNLVSWEIAVAQLRGTARYATLSVSAIVVSFSLMVAMAIMVTSFRNSLDLWVQKILPADLYVRAGYQGQSSFIDEAAVEALRNLPGVARLEASRFATLTLDPARPAVALIARPLDDARIERNLWIESRTDSPLPAGATPVWVSEAAADLHGLAPGDSLTLSLGQRPVEASIRGLWRDYENLSGAIIIDRAAYVRLSGDTAVNTVWIWLDEGASMEEMQQAVREQLPAGAAYDIRTPQELRRLSLQVFDRTFAVTYVLEIIAVVIGLFGISAGASAQVLARRGEFGALRYLGFTRSQIAATLALEGVGLGLLGVVAGLLTGAVVSLILIYVVNRQSFHWSMDLFVPTGLLATLSVALIACSAVIAMFSGRQAMTGDAVRAVKEDW
jgi:putative ABC transport system permease protein